MKEDKMGLPTIGMLQSFYAWWEEYERAEKEGNLIGRHQKKWWLNKKQGKFELFMMWLLDKINKDKKLTNPTKRKG